MALAMVQRYLSDAMYPAPKARYRPPTVYDLPAEVIGMILQKVVYSTVTTSECKIQLLALLLVSKAWSRVVLTLPSVWTLLSVTTPIPPRGSMSEIPKIFNWLHRSGSWLPVQLNLSISGEREVDSLDFLDALKFFAPKFMVFRLHCGRSMTHLCLSNWSTVFWNQLEVLSVSHFTDDGSIESMQTGTMPKLKELTLETCKLKMWRSTFPWAQLTHLRLLTRTELVPVMQVLSQCRQLEECIIQFSPRLALSSNRDRCEFWTPLPNLKRLKLMVDSKVDNPFQMLLSALCIPALESLAIHIKFPGVHISKDSLFNFFYDFRHSLQHLLLEGVHLEDSELTEVLTPLRHLRTLAITNHQTYTDFMKYGERCDFLPKLGYLLLKMGTDSTFNIGKRCDDFTASRQARHNFYSCQCAVLATFLEDYVVKST